MLIALIAVWFVSSVNETNQKIELKEIQVKDTQAELKQLELKYDDLNKKLQSTSGDKEKLDNERRKLKKQLEEAQRALQAKKAAKDRLAVTGSGDVAYAASGASSVAPSGSCADWVKRSGITEVSTALDLIGKESSCNPRAVNLTSGACGIPQDITGCSVGFDPIDQLNWMNNYILGRYKSWANARTFWACIGNCARYPGGPIVYGKVATWY